MNNNDDTESYKSRTKIHYVCFEFTEPKFYNECLVEFIVTGIFIIYCILLDNTFERVNDPNSVNRSNNTRVCVLDGNNILAKSDDARWLRISFGTGFYFFVWIWTVGHINGLHANPIVTICCFLLPRRISVVRSIAYIVSQLTGSVCGLVIVKMLISGHNKLMIFNNLGTISHNSDISDYQALGIEIILTFVLITVVSSCLDEKKQLVNSGLEPFVVGFCVAMNIMHGINTSGAVMNPARIFGPALVANKWEGQWIYYLGPLIGGLMAFVIYESFWCGDASLDKIWRLMSQGRSNALIKYFGSDNEMKESNSDEEVSVGLLKHKRMNSV